MTAVPTPTKTPKPTRTPSLTKDYPAFDYRLCGLMPDKFRGCRYQVSGVILSVTDGGKRWLIRLDGSSSGLILAESFPEPKNPGDTVRIWGQYAGLTGYESESGPVTVPLFTCEHVE